MTRSRSVTSILPLMMAVATDAVASVEGFVVGRVVRLGLRMRF